MLDEGSGYGGIFISYRRNDAAAYAGRLYDRLSDRFGERNVFMDVDSIAPGADFTVAVVNAVKACKILLVLMGNRWLATDAGHSRLDDERDFVRIEIETALQHGLRLIPILIDGAQMPPPHELPTSIQRISNLQAMEITHSGFRSDIQWLMDVVSGAVQPKSEEATPAMPPPAAQTSTTARSWRCELIKNSVPEVIVRLHLNSESHIIAVKWAITDTLQLDGMPIVSSKWSIKGTHRFSVSDGTQQLPVVVRIEERALAIGYRIESLTVASIELYGR